MGVKTKLPEPTQESYLARLGLLFPRQGEDSPDLVEEPEEDSQPTVGDPPPGAGPRRAVGNRLVRFTAQHVKVLSALALAAVIIATWAVMRARSVPVDQPTGTVSWSASGTTPMATGSDAAPSPTPDLWRVHVLGAVVHPGVIDVPAGARVIDAINAAGGLTPDADPADLNLAAVLTDGCQIMVGTTSRPQGEVRVGTGGASGDASATQPTSGTGTAGAKLNLNQATQAQLEALPGVGPVTAQAILEWRQKNGKFTSTSQLQEVSGIGPKTYAQLEPYVSV